MKYITAFFIFISIVLYFMYNLAQNKINTLESEKKALYANKCFLEEELEKRNKKALEASERMRELARLAKEEKNKGGFDWDSPLPDDTVVDKLRAN